MDIIQQRKDGRYIVFDPKDGQVKVSTDFTYVGENFVPKVLEAEEVNYLPDLFGEPFFL